MNILFTSSGRRSYLIQFFKDVISSRGLLHAANSDDNVTSFKFADKVVISPTIYSESYIDFLLEYSKKNNITLIIPLFDIDLPVLSKYKTKFSSLGIQVLVSNEEVIDICNDKWKTFEYLSQNSFKVPRTFLNLADFEEAYEQHHVTFPVIVKPRWGMGSIGLYKCDSSEELRVLYNKVKDEVFNTYLKFESSQNPENSVLIQEYITGKEYGLDVINDLHGKYITTIVKRKIAMRAGETDIAEVIESSSLSNIGNLVAAKLKHIANLDMDILEDNEGNYYILEMNARFGGGYPFSHLAGVDLPKAIVNWLDNTTPSPDLFKAKPGTLGMKNINVIKK